MYNKSVKETFEKHFAAYRVEIPLSGMLMKAL